MKTFSDLEHMRVYRQSLMVPFNEKNKKQGTVVHLLVPQGTQTDAIIASENLKNPHLIEGYYIDKSVAHLIAKSEDSVEEQSVDEAGLMAGATAGFISKLAVDAALKYSEKYINAKEAKTPAQKQAAAKFFMGQYNKGKKAYDKFKSRGSDKPLREVTPDAWWINWFGITSADIKVIGTNDRNRVSHNKFKNALVDNRLMEKKTDEFEKFLEGKEFYLISSGREDNGKLIPVKVEYFYCPQTDKIYNTDKTRVASAGILDYKHPITIADYLNRSKKTVIEIKDVLKICEENNKK